MIPGLYKDLVFVLRLRKPRKTSARRSSDEGYPTGHLLKWCPLQPNDVSIIAQNAEKGEGRKVERFYPQPSMHSLYTLKVFGNCSYVCTWIQLLVYFCI